MAFDVARATIGATSAFGLTVAAPAATVRNLSRDVTVYIGDADGFSVSDGFPVLPGEVLSLTLAGSRNLWFRTPAGSSDIALIRET